MWISLGGWREIVLRMGVEEICDAVCTQKSMIMWTKNRRHLFVLVDTIIRSAVKQPLRDVRGIPFL